MKRSFVLSYVFVRLVLAVSIPIDDCDETMNYWEPLHYLIYNKGLQTWEYSPEFSLRSYFYLYLFGAPAFLCKLFFPQLSKPTIMLITKLFLTLLLSISELLLVSALKSYSKLLSLISSVFILFSVPIIKASPAFLPSSSSLFLLNLAFYCVLKGTHLSYLFALSLSFAAFLWVWPFSVLCFVSVILFSLYKIFTTTSLKKIIFQFSFCFLLVFLPQVLVDSYLYGKLTLPSINIVVYNVFSSNGGPELYGVEPWYYYGLNLLVNGGIIFVLSILGIFALFYSLILFIKGQYFGSNFFPSFLIGVPSLIWFIFMSFQPHKEERFMHPSLTGYSVTAAYLLDKIFNKILTLKIRPKLKRISVVLYSICLFVIVLFVLLFAGLRCLALYSHYNAPATVYSELYNRLSTNQNSNLTVCVGKEWYRFQSHFYMPRSARLAFITSSFTGQLPQYFDESSNGLRVVQSGFNDLNVGDLSRFVDVSDCDYVVDFEILSQQEPYLSKDDHWKVIFEAKFLDSEYSSSFCKLIFHSYLEKFCVYGRYLLLKKEKEEG
ncbi:hypothetical protein RCL1_004834 [Eukaryota sp. TZLM3-RCL]